MYARIGTFDVKPSCLEPVVDHIREHGVAAFSLHDGFLGYQAFVDAGSGRLVGISYWTTRSALEASGDSARLVLSQVADLGAVLTGDPQILELAFDSRSDTPAPRAESEEQGRVR